MEGVKDVQGGTVRSSAPGLHGGRDEHAGGCPSVRSAPGYGAQDAGLFSPPGLPAADTSPKAQAGAYTGVIDRILEEDHKVPRKQRHTAKRIFERLRDEHGFAGKYTVVKDYVRERRRRTKEMFVPLSHVPGHAQCDFGEARVIIGGVEQKAHYFVLDLPHSDGCFIKAYPAETTESFLDGHVSAFAFLGGVPQSILYDNTRLAVARILGDGRRKRTRAFAELQSHYLFEDRFGRPGKGNDKGKVEGMVGYVRRNFLVPVPSFESFEALNAHLEQRCLARMDARLRGHTESIGQRMERDLEALLPLPAAPYDACDQRAGRVSSLSLVRYRTTDYSVRWPTAPRRSGKGLRGPGGHQLRGGGHRPTPPLLSAGRLRLRPHPLPAAFGAEDGRSGSGGAPAGVGPARGVCHAAPPSGVQDGTKGQAGIRPGAPVAGKLQAGRGVRRSAGLPPSGGAELRRREAPSAVPAGRTAAPARPGSVPLPAQGESEHHLRRGLHGPALGEGGMNQRSTLLLEHHLKELKLPSFLREHGKMAAQCAAEGVDHPQYLLRLAELELIDRHQRMVQRRIRAARFPAVKSLDTFDFTAIPSVNKQLVMELARCEYIQRRENVIAVGNSGTGKTHVALGLGLAACQRGMSVGFTTAAALVHEMMEARDEKRLLNLQRQLSRLSLLIIDEQGFVPLSPTGAELLFEVFSQRYERGSILVTTNLPFDEWTEVFGSERLTGALLDRLTHHVHILEMNGDSYRLKRSRETAAPPPPDEPDDA